MLLSRRITVLSASETGNSREVAEWLRDALEPLCDTVRLVDAFDYPASSLPDEDLLFMVTSTQGEGEPPMEAEELYDDVMGEAAPRMDGVEFAVLGLGDSAYGVNFNRMARRFDARYAELGAHRLMPHRECDLDYEATAERWIGDVVAALGAKPGESSQVSGNVVSPGASEDAYTLVGRTLLSSPDCAKQVYRIRLAAAHAIEYEPGDMMAVRYRNDDETVRRVLDAAFRGANDAGSDVVTRNGTRDATCEAATRDAARNADPALFDKLAEALRDRDITNTSPSLIARYASISGNETVRAAVGDPLFLERYACANPPEALFHDFPGTATMADALDIFTGSSRRLYSISNAQPTPVAGDNRGGDQGVTVAEVWPDVGAEGAHLVDLTVTRVTHELDRRTLVGACTGYLTGLPIGSRISADIVSNPRFHFPTDRMADVIMIALGSAIAPYRAFLQQRAYDHASGRAWLMVGNRHPRQDALYREELRRCRDTGLLTRLDVAWSRDEQDPQHVQDLITAAASDLWRWIESGASVFICGHGGTAVASIMAAVSAVVEDQGHMSSDEAHRYMADLERSGRLRH